MSCYKYATVFFDSFSTGRESSLALLAKENKLENNQGGTLRDSHLVKVGSHVLVALMPTNMVPLVDIPRAVCHSILIKKLRATFNNLCYTIYGNNRHQLYPLVLW